MRTAVPVFPLFPLRKHPERLRGGVLRVEVLALPAGSVPGWSRACLLALLFPLPWRLFPRLFPRGLNACER
jgi:hypothetical protein